jgi:type IV pilus assembly protein PilB
MITTNDPTLAPIVGLLERRGRIDPLKLPEIKAILAKNEDHPERALIQAGYANEQEIAEAYGEWTSLPVLQEVPVIAPESGPALRSLLSEKFCYSNFVAPLAIRGETIDLALISPSGLGLIEVVQFATSKIVNPMIGSISIVGKQLEQIFKSQTGQHEPTIEFIEKEEQGDEDENSQIVDLDSPPPADESGRIIRMVNQVFEQALRTSASDIHLEQFEDSCKFRLRIDGVLHEMPSPSRSAFVMILSRIKILAKMDIAEKRIPQDGAIALKTGQKRIDLRVSSVPTVNGEKIVMRILDKEAIPLDLTKLGLSERQSKDLIESIEAPHGLALVTGPTGSGKSTTLYSCLNLLNQPKSNICTVEDPVEYKFRGMNQIQVKSQIGLTFATALRAFLRQDPDIIMVGEVRDQETAEICLRAALTGHFVLSTLHTNDALSAVTRLVEMGIEPFLLSCVLRVLEAQRLVRRLCIHCKEPYVCEPEVAKKYGIEPGSTLYKPVGCMRCRRLGYKGRVGVFEVVRITPTLIRMIQTAKPLAELRKAARDEGMQLLFDSAMVKVREGLTSLEAALSVAMADEE